MHTKEDILAKLKELVNARMMREEDYKDFSLMIAEEIMMHRNVDKLFEEPLETWKKIADAEIDHVLQDWAFDAYCESEGIESVDEMKCPFCGDTDIYLVTNITPAICTGVNEEEGVFEYECENCKKHFFIYEKTKAVKRIITKTVSEMMSRTGETGIWL